MDLPLTPDQRAQIELIALYAGKTPSQVLVEAAESLIDRHAGASPMPQEHEPPTPLTREQLEQRFAQMLRHQRHR